MKSLIAALIFTFAISLNAKSLTNYQSPDKKTKTVTKVVDQNKKTVKKSKAIEKCDENGCCSKDNKDKDCKNNKTETPKK